MSACCQAVVTSRFEMMAPIKMPAPTKKAPSRAPRMAVRGSDGLGNVVMCSPGVRQFRHVMECVGDFADARFVPAAVDYAFRKAVIFGESHIEAFLMHAEEKPEDAGQYEQLQQHQQHDPVHEAALRTRA